MRRQHYELYLRWLSDYADYSLSVKPAEVRPPLTVTPRQRTERRRNTRILPWHPLQRQKYMFVYIVNAATRTHSRSVHAGWKYLKTIKKEGAVRRITFAMTACLSCKVFFYFQVRNAMRRPYCLRIYKCRYALKIHIRHTYCHKNAATLRRFYADMTNRLSDAHSERTKKGRVYNN